MNTTYPEQDETVGNKETINDDNGKAVKFTVLRSDVSTSLDRVRILGNKDSYLVVRRRRIEQIPVRGDNSPRETMGARYGGEVGDPLTDATILADNGETKIIVMGSGEKGFYMLSGEGHVAIVPDVFRRCDRF